MQSEKACPENHPQPQIPKDDVKGKKTQNDDKSICRDTFHFAVLNAHSTLNTTTTKVDYLHPATLQTGTTLQENAVFEKEK